MRPRVSIRVLMAVVVFLAVGFAALRNADDFWAGATFTLAVVSVSAALVGAAARKGAARAPWAGFAVTGLACLVIWLATPSTVGFVSGPPRLLPFWGFGHLRTHINPAADNGGEAYLHYVQVSNSLQIVLLGIVGAILGHLVAVKDERPDG